MINVIKGLLDLELVPIQDKILTDLITSDKVSTLVVGPQGAGNNYVLAAYALIRAIEKPGSTVAIGAASFRLAKQVIGHCESILQNENCSIKAKAIQHDVDQHIIKLMNGSQIVAQSLGDGTRIRGQRAHTIILPGFASISKEYFEAVIAGFGVINIDISDYIKAKAESLGQNASEFIKAKAREIKEFKAKSIPRLVLSEHDESVPYIYMRYGKENKTMDVVEVIKEDFPAGWFDEPKKLKSV